MPAEQNSADNYAVLFVGGVNAGSNHTRYYNSLKGIYEVITNQYGLPRENVYLLYADKGQDFDKNAQQELASEIGNLTASQGVRKLREFASSNGFDLSVDQAKLLWVALTQKSLNARQLEEFKDLYSRIRESQASFYIRAKGDPAKGGSGMNIVNLDILQKSDLSFADGSRLSSGNSPDLRGALSDLSARVDSNDHVFFWTFDHGGFGPIDDLTKNMVDIDGNLWSDGESLQGFNWGRRDVGNKALLNGWGDEIVNTELAQWLAPVIENSGYTTLSYAQCFAGGMLDASRSALASAENAYGMAATNSYEVSNNYSFAEGVRLALQGSSDPKANQVFASAKASDSNAATYPYADNDGPRKVGIEHPWAFGGSNGNFSIFSVGDREHPLEKQGIDLLETSQFAPESTADQLDLLLNEDASLDLSVALVDQFGSDVIVEAVAWPSHGSLELVDGALTYVPITDFYGSDSLLLRYSTSSGTAEIRLSLTVKPVNDAPHVADDFVTVDAGTKSIEISVDSQPGYFGDVDPEGQNLRISSFSSPENGRLKKIGETGLRYKPNTGFVGTDSFLYQVTDGEAYSVAEVSISVGGEAFSLDPFDGFYQLTSDGADPITNPIRAKDGSLLSDDSSGRWDVVAAVSEGSMFKILLQGEGRREGFYQIWTADESGQVINQPKRWLTADQIENKSYGGTSWGFVTTSADQPAAFASSGTI
jgi:hypothetical protein